LKKRGVVSLSAKRKLDARTLLTTFEQLCLMVQAIDAGQYEVHSVAARERVAARDISDWPILATAILLNCPIWTEDRDFFGSGVATWTTANVEVYLRAA
jgi:predicted nucleic acid-binding protein